MPRGLKCIGGVADGERRIIADDAPYYLVRVRQPLRSTFNLTGGPDSPLVETRAEHYVVDRVHSEGEVIEFLRPERWTSLQAMRHVLT